MHGYQRLFALCNTDAAVLSCDCVDLQTYVSAAWITLVQGFCSYRERKLFAVTVNQPLLDHMIWLSVVL
jgi:hypothetical protein